MSKTGFIAITCAAFLAPACSSGPNNGTTGSTGLVETATSASSSGGSTGESANASASTSASSGGNNTSGSTTAGTGGSTGTTTAGTISAGTTTGMVGPDFALSVPSAFTLPPGGEGVLQVSIQRDAGTVLDTDSLIFAMATDGGIIGLFDPSETAGDATALTLDVDPSVPAGDYPVLINASSSTNPQSAHDTFLTLTVTNQAITTLLVDDDASSNNADGGGLPSASDAFFAQLLQSSGVVYNTYVIPSTGTDEFSTTILDKYTTVIWYTGANNLANGNGCLTSQQEQFLELWLDEGGKTALMFSPFLVQDLDPFPFWQDQPTDNFLSFYVGAAGCDVNPQGNFDGKSFDATGVDGTPFGTVDGGEDGASPATFEVDPTPIADTAAVINVGDGGSIPLVTVEADELGVGLPQAWPCSVMNTKAGAAGTSTVVYVGMPIEDIPASDGGGPALFFTALQQSLP
jgi:hypothetical protein